jgi:hypothetical protein
MSGGISNLKAFGVVSAPNATSVGGLFGQAHNTNMTYVSAYGNVTGKSSVGGLIGLISGIIVAMYLPIFKLGAVV